MTYSDPTRRCVCSCAGQLPIVWGYAGPVGVATLVYMTSASDQPCSYVNHYRFSFGLDDRYEKSLKGQSAIRLYRNLSL